MRDSPMDTSSQPSANPTSSTPTRVTRSSSRRSTSQTSSAEPDTVTDTVAETPIQATKETPGEVELNGKYIWSSTNQATTADCHFFCL